MSDPRTAAWFRRFGELEARGQSALYEEWALGVAGDEQLLELIERLPLPKRQPNLILAVSRLLGAPVGPFGPWRDWLLANWPAVQREALLRSTQTNEPLRCAVLLPALGMIDGPIALLEIGASAGLCLIPDRYSYLYKEENGEQVRLDPVTGPSEVVLECDVTGDVPVPTTMPNIVWRAGIDLNPLDVANADDVRWLETLIWPEQTERVARIRAASQIVRADAPQLVTGDAVGALAEVARTAPSDATLVVVASGTLVYLAPADRERFVALVAELGARRPNGARLISLEGAAVLPGVRTALHDDPFAATQQPPARFVLALDGHPLALASPHGRTLDWL